PSARSTYHHDLLSLMMTAAAGIATPASGGPSGAQASSRSPSAASLPFNKAKKLRPGTLASAGASHGAVDPQLLPERTASIRSSRTLAGAVPSMAPKGKVARNSLIRPLPRASSMDSSVSFHGGF